MRIRFVVFCLSLMAFANGYSALYAESENSDQQRVLYSNEKYQKLYETVLKNLEKMKPRAGTAEKDDWFVVGGAIGSAANFNKFQGVENVAKRVVDFVSQNNGKCQWQIIARVQEEKVAQNIVESKAAAYQRKARAAQQLAQRRQASRRICRT